MKKSKNRLKEQRERSRLTQKEVAKLLEIDVTTISKHEAGTRGLSSEDVKKYSDLYKVQSHELFMLEQGAVEESPSDPG